MTEEINNEQPEISVEDLQKALSEKDAIIQDLQNQFGAVKSKADQLLDETKKAKAKARAEAEAKEQAEYERLSAKARRAKKNGDFEQLLASSEKQRKELEERLNSLQNNISTEKTRSESLRIASELADGANAEILSEFISKRIKYTDEGIKVLDQDGSLTVSSLDDLKNEFANSAKYKSLIRGSKSSGGGAVGDGGSASETMTVDRAKFESMNAEQRMVFVRKGGKIQD